MKHRITAATAFLAWSWQRASGRTKRSSSSRRSNSMVGAFYFRPFAVLLAVLLAAVPAKANLIPITNLTLPTGLPNLNEPVNITLQETLVELTLTPPIADPPPIVINPINVETCQSLPATRIVRDCALAMTSFESRMVSSWLAYHGLPQSDAELIYKYGRTDLRSALRTHMLGYVMGVIGKPANERDDDEKAVYNWVQKAVQQNEIALYTAALNEYNRFNQNPCLFKMDPDIASEYGLEFDNLIYCYPVAGNYLKSPETPDANYFKAFGMKKAYHDKLSAQQADIRAALQSQRDMHRNGSLAALGSGLAAGIVAGTVIYKTMNTIAPFLFRAAEVTAEVFVKEVLKHGSGAAAKAAAKALALSVGRAVSIARALNVASIVIVAIEIGVTAGIAAANDAKNQQALAALPAERAAAENPPDLAAMAKDGIGVQKIVETFLAATMPEVEATQPLPAPDPDARFYLTLTGSNEVTTSFDYKSWYFDGQALTASLYGGWFLQHGTDVQGRPFSSIATTIYYRDNRVQGRVSASRLSSGRFLVIKDTDASTPEDTICTADPITGLTPSWMIGKTCASFVTNFLKIEQGTDASASGPTKPGTIGDPNRFAVLVQIPVRPVFNPPFAWNLTTGTNRTFVAGPAPGLNADIPCTVTSTGALPNGVSFTNGAFSGQPQEGSQGTYKPTVTATCGGVSRSQTYELKVYTGLQFTWPTPSTKLTLTRGRRTKFKIFTAAGSTLFIGYGPNALPVGMKLTYDGDGTATVEGIPAAHASPCPAGNPACDVVRAFGPAGDIDMRLNYSVVDPVFPAIPADPIELTWTGGEPNSHIFNGSAANVKVNWFYITGLPQWATFRDHGENNGSVSGTPPVSATAQTSELRYVYSAGGDSQQFRGPYRLRLTVQPPLPDTAALSPLLFTVGSFGSGSLTSTTPSSLTGLGGSWTVSGLPQGLSGKPDGTGTMFTVSGTPAPGTAGLYHLPLKFETSSGIVWKSADLLIAEPPGLSEVPDRVVVYKGVASRVTLYSTKGFPKQAIEAAGDGLPASTGLTMSLNTAATSSISEIGLLTVNGANGKSNGSLTIGGTPTGTGIYPANVIATVDLGAGSDNPTVTKHLMIHVVDAGDMNLDGSVDCRDVTVVTSAFGNVRGQPGYNDLADANRDRVVNIWDLTFVMSRPAAAGCSLQPLSQEAIIDNALRATSAGDTVSSGTGNASPFSSSGLAQNQKLVSGNGKFHAVMQADGNFVIYDANQNPLYGGAAKVPIWNSATHLKGLPPYRLAMQPDGNLVVYGSSDKDVSLGGWGVCRENSACIATWNTGPRGGAAPYTLAMQNDGNLVVYDSSWRAVWSSGTNR